MSDINDSNHITAEQYINGIINVYNYNDTYGVIILHNGIALRVSSLFEYFREQWNIYNLLLQKAITEEENNSKLKEDEEKSQEASEELEEFLELTDNGIISNNEVEIKVQDISAMVAEYKKMEIMKAIKNQKQQKENNEEDEFYND